jgi:hypothetical protein
MSITERVGTGLLVAAVVALLLPFAACSTSDTPPYPVIEVTPVAQVASARAIIATASRQNFMSGDFVIYPVPLASPGVLDILVDWTFPNSWIYVYFGQTKCTYEELEKRTCPFLIASETQLPKPRVLYSQKLSAGQYYLVLHSLPWDARTKTGSDGMETIIFQLGLTVTAESGVRLPVRLGEPIVLSRPGR